VRGEVAAEILTDFPERLTRLSSVELWDGSGVPRRAAVRKCWLSHSRGGQAIFHFAASDSVDDARKLVGLEVQVPLADRVKLPAGSYYISDLVGCAVREKHGGDVGLVRDVEIHGDVISGTPNLVVDTARGELLIPLAQEICVNVDLAARQIEVVLPEGLRELNLE
jgi:16S rRNA processing protein RimM